MPSPGVGGAAQDCFCVGLAFQPSDGWMGYIAAQVPLATKPSLLPSTPGAGEGWQEAGGAGASMSCLSRVGKCCEELSQTTDVPVCTLGGVVVPGMCMGGLRYLPSCLRIAPSAGDPPQDQRQSYSQI